MQAICKWFDIWKFQFTIFGYLWYFGIYVSECGLATQILGQYLVACVCDQQVMEVINRADPIFDMYMRAATIYPLTVHGCKIFDNKNCHRAPPAHVLTSLTVTPLLTKIYAFVEWNRKANTPTYPETTWSIRVCLFHNSVEKWLIDYSGKCRVCVLYLVTGVGYPALLKSLRLIYSFRPPHHAIHH